MNDSNRDCQIAEGLLPEAWQPGSNLDARDQAWLDRHLKSCPDCAAAATLWTALERLPEAEPSPTARRRFDRMLGAYAHASSQGVGWRERAARLWTGLVWNPALVAALCLVAGAAGGWLLRARSAAPAPDQQIAELQNEVHATRQLVVLSLLQQQSPGDRLQGVSWSNRMHSPDPQVTAALLHSLNFDSSPDVRLAALDALERVAALPGAGPAAPQIQTGLVQSFSSQKSPLVQIALLDSLVELRDPSARALLQQVRNNAAYNPEVRQRAAWGLQQPSWN